MGSHHLLVTYFALFPFNSLNEYSLTTHLMSYEFDVQPQFDVWPDSLIRCCWKSLQGLFQVTGLGCQPSLGLYVFAGRVTLSNNNFVCFITLEQ